MTVRSGTSSRGFCASVCRRVDGVDKHILRRVAAAGLALVGTWVTMALL